MHWRILRPPKIRKVYRGRSSARYRFAACHVRNKSALGIASGVGYAPPCHSPRWRHHIRVTIFEKNLSSVYAAALVAGRPTSIVETSASSTRRGYKAIPCFETIEQVAEYGMALDNLHRLLRPGRCSLSHLPTA